MLSAALLAILVVQQAQVRPPADTAAKKDTARLGSVEIRESARGSHRYSAPWTASALRISTPLRDTPLSVSVITRAAIREQSMLSIADAVRYAPGVTMGQGEGHRDAPTIRGNASTSDLFVDGVRDDVQYFRDLYNVERVEVLGGANAMTFGRGGGGGVINRVSKRATFDPVREATLESGSYSHGRLTLDVGGSLSDALAGRVNLLFQDSENFRDRFENRRTGVSPQLTYAISPSTVLRGGGEFFSDDRRVDRGLPSFQGRPSSAPLSLFFGNPDSSYAEARVIGTDATIEHSRGDRAVLRSHLRFTRYDKFYQNVYPGSAVDAGGTVSLAAYNSETFRSNLFSQSEAVVRLPTARMPQTLLVGVELGRQATDNIRNTGYFNGTATSYDVPASSPTVNVPVAFRQSASDANNFVLASVASFYAQDQLWLTPKLQATVGVRFERFDLSLENFRNGQLLKRVDNVLSPRAGLVFKPVEPVSLYSSVSVSHLPSSGDQFSGLTPTTQTLEPERFTNQEVGVKWSVVPALTVNLAAYQLFRTNAAAPSALDPGVIVQTGKQETSGLELSLTGQVRDGWDVLGAFTAQSAKITSNTTAAPAGRIVPLVPRRTASLWNRVRLHRALALGLGAIHQSEMYASIDNAVTLPAFWRLDAAAYVPLTRGIRLQVNLENVLDEKYYATSHGNNNIMPGSPRAVRVSVTSDLR
jgi:catecholate siderophore receptor